MSPTTGSGSHHNNNNMASFNDEEGEMEYSNFATRHPWIGNQDQMVDNQNNTTNNSTQAPPCVFNSTSVNIPAQNKPTVNAATAALLRTVISAVGQETNVFTTQITPELKFYGKDFDTFNVEWKIYLDQPVYGCL
jgi:hypothetical protein